ncbi:CubicO group peptidase (beta-lactamase class C family) [Parabacteroides sp. PFB2-10]|uniref:serine hydrolase domain-containing protein n=1 Tax=Parabacteroides sp. PFB2-10 TaxID=1742405 RepID=UPI002474E588|nr:serine hydrolase domain-containing protein [Parabacteroides sp. PFB2-10]MDH6312126.1 CubicO group peptidase (beta-lactamase class C family) [Parabacteroides sp. PFB2-10]MDL2245110.1 beta-lactamase family protein [Parabacteroides sp. OttesenSCG-928-J18]
MKKSLVSMVCMVCLLSGISHGGAVAQTFKYSPDYKAIRVDKSRLDRVDQVLQDYVDQGIIPHALTFVAKNGQVVHHKAFGWRDVEKKIPLQKDDIFRMYSQTKAITSVALLILFEQGKFQLDDPVVRYIPEMTDQVIERRISDTKVDTRTVRQPVTIRHLLSHSSGVNPQRDMMKSDYPTLAEYVKDLVKCPLLFEPGTNWNYNPASNVCGYLVEYFSGKPLQEFVREEILEPLGIKDMAYFYDESYRERFVTVYRQNESGAIEPTEMWSGKNPFGADRRYAAGSSGLSGTIEGYARFCQMILNYGVFNGKRILGRHTVEMMKENQLPYPNSGGADFQFGLAFQIHPENPVERKSISNFTPMVSPGALSWGGMANTDYIIDHKEDMIILLYTNRVPDTKIWEKFLNTVYQALE